MARRHQIAALHELGQFNVVLRHEVTLAVERTIPLGCFGDSKPSVGELVFARGDGTELYVVSTTPDGQSGIGIQRVRLE